MPWSRLFLCGVCIFSLDLLGFSSGTPAQVNWELAVGVSVTANACLSMLPCNELETCLACNPAFALWSWDRSHHASVLEKHLAVNSWTTLTAIQSIPIVFVLIVFPLSLLNLFRKSVDVHSSSPARYQPQPADLSVWSAGYGLTWPQHPSHLSASALRTHRRRRWLTQSATDNRWCYFICSVCWVIAEKSLSHCLWDD